MSELQFKNIQSIIDDYDLLLFDLWGVLVEGDQTYPGVVEVVNDLMKQKKVFFLSNAPRPAFRLKNKLANWGLKNLTDEIIVTSGDVARGVINKAATGFKDNMPVIYHLGADKNDDILAEFTHKLTDDLDKANVFLLSLYREENENLDEFNDLLQEAAKRNIFTVCANPDTTIPNGGMTRYCAGHFAGIVEKYGGSVIYTGKPRTEIYNNAFMRVPEIPKERILMIGDTFETDILGARDAGIDSALVISGNSVKIHGNYKSMDEKITAIENHANKLGFRPTIFTSLL